MTGTLGFNNLKILDGPFGFSLYTHSLLRIKMWRYLVECLSIFLFILMPKSPRSVSSIVLQAAHIYQLHFPTPCSNQPSREIWFLIKCNRGFTFVLELINQNFVISVAKGNKLTVPLIRQGGIYFHCLTSSQNKSTCPQTEI